MPCGCGRTYILNENYGFSNRRKKDTSFRSFITFLLVVFLVCIAIYCVILTIDRIKGKNLQQSNASEEHLHGEIEQSNRENSSISIENITNDYYTSSTKSEQPETTTTLLMRNDFSKVTQNDEDVATQKSNFYTVTQNTDVVDSDSKTMFNKPLTNNNDFDIITTPTTDKQYLVTDLETGTELNSSNTLKNNVTKEEIKIDKNIFMKDIGSTTKSYEIVSSKEESKNVDVISVLGTKENYFITASIKTNVESTTESKDNFNNSLEIVTQESNELLPNHSSSDTEKSNKETITTETAMNQQFTNSEVGKKSFQMRPRYYSRIVEKYTTKSNNKETMLTKAEEELPNEPTSYLALLNNDKLRLQETTFPNNIDKKVTNSFSNIKTSQIMFDITTNRIKEKKEFESGTLPKEVFKDDSKVNKNENVCTETSCKEKAGQMLQLMNHSFDPCEDFYQFSCGGVRTVNEKYTDILLKHVFTFPDKNDKYLKGFRKFFNSCIKYETEYRYSTKIKQVLSSNVRDSNLTSLLSFLMLRQSTPLFEVQYGFVGGQEGYGMQILPPNSNKDTTGLKDWSLQSQIEKQCLNFDPKLKYESELDLPIVYEDYRKCKEATFKKMAENFVTEKLDRTKVPNKSILRDFLSFFSKMNKVSGYFLQNAILNQEYSKTNIQILSQKYPQIDWQDLFKIITGKDFETSTPIFVYLEQEYFKLIMSDLKDRLLKTEKDVIETLKLYYQLELYQNLLAPKENIEEFCINQAVELMPEIATKILYETSGLEVFHFSEFKESFSELKDKFYWMIDVSQLEEPNKKAYKDNLEILTLKLFEDNEEWKIYLEKSYDSFYLMDDYLSNLFMFIENKRKSRNALRSDAEDFIFTQFVDSQFHSSPKIIPGTNVIAVPNRFLYKLLTNQEFPPYVVKSYMEFYLTRALASHLNNAEKLKSPFHKQFLNSLNSYVENGDDVKILKDQRISYKMKLFWQEVVEFSEATRFANNMALDMAFQDIFNTNATFTSLPWISKDYSPQQQFFILMAQEYCENPTVPALAQHLYESSNIPSTFLVENMIMNSEAFSQTFECPQGTPMNPEEKSQYDNFIFAENNYEYEQVNK